jgi:hypothetical protein
MDKRKSFRPTASSSIAAAWRIETSVSFRAIESSV